jgi:hypothetical protein
MHTAHAHRAHTLPTRQLVYGVLFVGLIDGGFSGDWVSYGYITPQLESELRAVAVALGGVHIACAATAAGSAVPAAGPAAGIIAAAILSGPLELLRVSVAALSGEAQAAAGSGGGKGGGAAGATGACTSDLAARAFGSGDDVVCCAMALPLCCNR